MIYVKKALLFISAFLLLSCSEARQDEHLMREWIKTLAAGQGNIGSSPERNQASGRCTTE